MNIYEPYRVAVPEGVSGDWQVSKFTVGALGKDSKRLYYALQGRDVPEGTYTRLTHNREVVMSDTPSEIQDHMQVIRHIELLGGYILVNGLGLGVVLKAALASPKVKHVEVVEISEDVIRLVSPTYQADPRLTIHHADAFTWKPPRDIAWTVVWHDIWSDICTDNLAEMAKLHRRYASKVAGWQGSWSKELCLYYRRREQRGSINPWTFA